MLHSAHGVLEMRLFEVVGGRGGGLSGVCGGGLKVFVCLDAEDDVLVGAASCLLAKK